MKTKYSVKQLADLAGVSIRTLHYYDEIGLLQPALIQENGYRVYEQFQLMKLQQILFFKELEFPLEDIVQMMNAKDFNTLEALKDQKKLLELKRQRLGKLIITIDETMKNLKGGEEMKNDDLFKSFGDDELVENMQEAKARWGNTNPYKQSMAKVKNWTKEDYERVKQEGVEFTKKLAQAMDLPVEDPKVQSLVAEHRKGIEYFYELSNEMYRNLAQMYVDDPRFTAYYDKVRPGLAKWLNQAINYYCDQQAKQ